MTKLLNEFYIEGLFAYKSFDEPLGPFKQLTITSPFQNIPNRNYFYPLINYSSNIFPPHKLLWVT